MQGLYCVLVTPFRDDGSLDLASLERHVEAAAASGARGLTALGVNGEAAFLDDRERAAVLERVLDVAGDRLPVVAGVSAPDRLLAAHSAAAAQVAGAAAAMVAVPPRASELVAHLAAVADAAPGLELVLQDYPASGHEPVTAQALADAAEQVPAVVAVKAEDPPTPAKIRELRALAPRLRRLGGLGALWLLWELRAGADGTMTGFGYPELLAAVAEAALAGDDAEAQRLYELALPALVWESQPVVGLALRKALLAERGIIESRHLRAPSPAVPGARDEARGLVRALTDLVVP